MLWPAYALWVGEIGGALCYVQADGVVRACGVTGVQAGGRRFCVDQRAWRGGPLCSPLENRACGGGPLCAPLQHRAWGEGPLCAPLEHRAWGEGPLCAPVDHRARGEGPRCAPSEHSVRGEGPECRSRERRVGYECTPRCRPHQCNTGASDRGVRLRTPVMSLDTA